MSGLQRTNSIAPGVLGSKIKETFTPTGDFETDKARAKAYATAVGMDQANTNAAVIMCTQGPSAAAKAMMEDCGGDYCAMRAKYG